MHSTSEMAAQLVLAGLGRDAAGIARLLSVDATEHLVIVYVGSQVFPSALTWALVLAPIYILFFSAMGALSMCCSTG